MKIRTTTLVLLLAVSTMAAPLGTEFTYQGVLSDAGAPASGIFDFRFFLYNADAGGSQVGPVVLIEDLTVTDGRIATQLDFGSVFDGTALWLEVGVRDGGLPGAYTVLSPRQELTAAPFAQHSQSADTADIASHATTADSATTAGSATAAGDSDLLDGMDGSYYLGWSNFVGIPGDLADGDDDTLADLSCAEAEITRWNGTTWECSDDDDTPYARTYVVGPVGTPTQNGTALRSAVQAIDEPTGREEAVLVVVEPGVYDLGVNYLIVWNWMTLEGAGEDSTFITNARCDVGATIYALADHVGLRRLTVENTCSNSGATARAGYFSGEYAAVENCTFKVENAASSNIAVQSSLAYLKMSHVTMKAANGTDDNLGLLNSGYGADLRHVDVNASGGSSHARAIENSGSDFRLRDSTLEAAQSTNECIGFRNSPSATGFLLESVTIAAQNGCTGTMRGIDSDGSSGRIEDVNIRIADTGIFLRNSTPSTSTVTVRGLKIDDSYNGVISQTFTNPINLTIEDCRIISDAFAVANNASPGLGSVRVSGSYLESVSGVFGEVACVATYDDSTFYPNTCP